VCDQETSNARRLKPATGLWKIQPQWVVTPGKQTTTTTTTTRSIEKRNDYTYSGENKSLTQIYV
jgi:hypothetical protein